MPFTGNIEYMAPEAIKQEPHDTRVDLWSLGVVLYEMLHGKLPFTKNSIEDTQAAILRRDFSFGEISEDAKSVIESLLQINPNDRPQLLSLFTTQWMMRNQKTFNIDYEKFLYKPSDKTKSSPVNSNIFSSGTLHSPRTPETISTSKEPSINNLTKSEANTLQKSPESKISRETFDVNRTAKNPFSVSESTNSTFGRQTSPSYTQAGVIDINRNQESARRTAPNIDGASKLEERKTKERNLEMSFQDKVEMSTVEEVSEVTEETFGVVNEREVARIVRESKHQEKELRQPLKIEQESYENRKVDIRGHEGYEAHYEVESYERKSKVVLKEYKNRMNDIYQKSPEKGTN